MRKALVHERGVGTRFALRLEREDIRKGTEGLIAARPFRDIRVGDTLASAGDEVFIHKGRGTRPRREKFIRVTDEGLIELGDGQQVLPNQVLILDNPMATITRRLTTSA